MMRPLGRPIGVWIATAYLLGLLALGVFWTLDVPVRSGSLFVLLTLLLLILSVVLLPLLSRWAVLVTAGLAAAQGGSYLATILSGVPEPLGLENTVVFSIQYNLAPLLLLTATAAVALYTAWLWSVGALR